MHRKSLPLLLFAFAILAPLPLAAPAASSGVKNLPGVENESAASAVPTITPDQVQRTGIPRTAASASAMTESQPAEPPIRFESQGQARDKIRRAYLLQQYDEVQRMGRAALAEWPDDAAFQYYVKVAEQKLTQPRALPEKESPYRRMRDLNRDKEIKALMNKVGEGQPAPPVTAAQPPAATPAAGASRTPAAVPTKAAVTPVSARPNAEPPVRQAAGESAMSKIKAQLGKPALLGALGGIVVLGLIVVALLRRKPAAREKPEIKPAAKKAKAKTVVASEPAEPAQPALAPLSASEELDSLFKPASSQPVAVTAADMSGIDELFGAPTEPPTRVSPPMPRPEPQPEPEPEITLDVTHEPEPLGAPIRLDEPIMPPQVKTPPRVEPPPIMADFVEPEPVTVSAEHEIIPPISVNLPEVDPFYKRADEPEPITVEASSVDLPSIDAPTEEPTAAGGPDSFFQPVMPDILEPPSIQPEFANTDSYVIAQPAPDLASEETVSAEADLPSIDTTPSVSVHRDETLALDADTRQIMQETAVSPDIPAPSQPHAADARPSAGDDLFSREYQKGLNDFAAENWAGAVHHLSIAAALKPSSAEVKERLREARRLRKESSGA